MMLLNSVKFWVEDFFSNFVAFSEYMNFNIFTKTGLKSFHSIVSVLLERWLILGNKLTSLCHSYSFVKKYLVQKRKKKIKKFMTILLKSIVSRWVSFFLATNLSYCFSLMIFCTQWDSIALVLWWNYFR